MSLPLRPFYFIRHGQAHHNTSGHIAGVWDTELTQLGKQQATAAAQKLQGHGITRIVSSPLQRAAETARAINQSLHLPLTTDLGLAEQNYGAWEKRHYTEICTECNIVADSYDYLNHIPADGESFDNLKIRATSSITALFKTYPDDTLLLVGHGGFLCALHHALFNTFEDFPNATPYHFQPTPTGWQITALNT